ncbi:hypothetical protein SAMN06265367_103526 [Algoriphagus winogradskyi]|uniref:Uncharacterized protein n=1 Tax=Algoriphagus winogradskyi TaxID=237017 RepID=A0ABY1P0E4_9BACT|nr:hypothetical protein SAMN06265367_103526 [Algoriphagus winogradskyi]
MFYQLDCQIQIFLELASGISAFFMVYSNVITRLTGDLNC